MEGSISMAGAAAGPAGQYYDFHPCSLIGTGHQPPVAPLSWVSSFLSKEKEKGPQGAGEVPSGSLAAAPIPDVFAVVPPKLADKILALEFVDMADLLPEQWRISESQEGTCCSLRTTNKKKLLTDILVWLDCFSTMVAVLSIKFADKTPHFMAYQQTIIHASRNFTGTAWASYDVCFRRKAANRRSLDWGVVDQDLYSKSFTGRAKGTPRCIYCLSDAHVSDECVDAPFEARKKDLRTTKEICMLFNKPGGERVQVFPLPLCSCLLKMWCRSSCSNVPQPVQRSVSNSTA